MSRVDVHKKQRVKTARGRKISSIKWLDRKLNDRYIAMAKSSGYRSRAAFKLLEIHQKFGIFKNAKNIVDLGAAPGSWLQVAKAEAPEAKILGLDLKVIEPIESVHTICGDFMETAIQKQIVDFFGCKVDLIMSDMAANSCGDKGTDHLRIMSMVEMAFEFSILHLNNNGIFIAKMLRGGEEQQILQKLKGAFKIAKFYKPEASYADSSEIFIVALGFSGNVR